MSKQLQLTFEDLQPPSPIELLTPDELYDRIDEKLLRSLVGAEDCRIEFKPNSFAKRDLAEYASMWCNTAPHGGIIILGIRNDKVFEGMLKVGIQEVNEFEKAISNNCPDAVWSCKKTPIRRDGDGIEDFVLVYRIQYHPIRVVKTSWGKACKRLGDSIHRLTDAEVRILEADKGEVRYETEPVKAIVYPKDFDLSAIDAFVKSVIDVRQLDNGHTREDILEIMHLGKIDTGEFIPNVACSLLFAKDPQLVIPGCRIRILRFEGETEGSGPKWNVVKDIPIDGPLPRLIEESAKVLTTLLREFSRLGPGGKFISSPEYPSEAWWEAIVNACAHRCYGNGLANAVIFIKMFDDRLEIVSPGPFPPFVTPGNIYTTTSVPRNPFLMEGLRHMQFVKAAHEGTRRMRDMMQQSDLPIPIFEQSESGGAVVRVTLRNNIKQRKLWVDSDVAAILGAQLADRLSPHQKRCVNWMAEHGEMSVNDAVRVLGGPNWHTARKILFTLVDVGIVQYVHSGEAIDRQARFKLIGSIGMPKPKQRPVIDPKNRP